MATCQFLLGKLFVVLNWIKLIKNLWKFYFNLFHLDSLSTNYTFSSILLFAFLFFGGNSTKFKWKIVENGVEHWTPMLISIELVNLNVSPRIAAFPDYTIRTVCPYICVSKENLFTFSHFHNHNVLLSSDFQ